jgi:hypothetical protein
MIKGPNLFKLLFLFLLVSCSGGSENASSSDATAPKTIVGSAIELDIQEISALKENVQGEDENLTLSASELDSLKGEGVINEEDLKELSVLL